MQQTENYHRGRDSGITHRSVSGGMGGDTGQQYIMYERGNAPKHACRMGSSCHRGEIVAQDRKQGEDVDFICPVFVCTSHLMID